MTRPCTVALCDILGFTKLIETVPLETVIEKPLVWFRKALHYAIHKAGFPFEPPSLEKLRDQKRLGIGWFSDTVLLYTLEDTDENVRDLIQTVGWLLFETTMSLDWTRVRGAIAHGEVYVDPDASIFVGKPIIEAFQLEKEQQWSGCAVAPSGEDRLRQIVREEELRTDLLPFDKRHIMPGLWLTRYPVPLKKGRNSLLAVDWTLGLHPDWDLVWSRDRNEPNADEWAQNRSVCEKWENTRQFHRDMCRSCRFPNS